MKKNVRIVLNVTVESNGVELEKLQNAVAGAALKERVGQVLLREACVLVTQCDASVSEVAMPAENVCRKTLEAHFLERIMSGDLKLADVPAALASYGLQEPTAFVSEMVAQVPALAPEPDAPTLYAQFEAFVAANQSAIASLASVAKGHEDQLSSFFDEQCDALRSYVGGSMANEAEDAADQEEALEQADSWVSGSVSGDLNQQVAATLWLNGLEQGSAKLFNAWTEAMKLR